MDLEKFRTYKGIVLRGEERGKALGFPTANIALDDTELSGIYAGKVRVVPETEWRIAAVYADQRRGLLEAHVLDFSEDLYGKEIELTLEKKIRDAERFSDDAALSAAIALDIESVRAHFAE